MITRTRLTLQHCFKIKTELDLKVKNSQIEQCSESKVCFACKNAIRLDYKNCRTAMHANKGKLAHLSKFNQMSLQKLGSFRHRFAILTLFDFLMHRLLSNLIVQTHRRGPSLITKSAYTVKKKRLCTGFVHGFLPGVYF